MNQRGKRIFMIAIKAWAVSAMVIMVIALGPMALVSFINWDSVAFQYALDVIMSGKVMRFILTMGLFAGMFWMTFFYKDE